ncbi:hypothetical protein FRC03_012079 [Tulasnella sp. 419]|nr:hypothetical protein FRC03_012079 [Tulasnella sp. 419]
MIANASPRSVKVQPSGYLSRAKPDDFDFVRASDQCDHASSLAKQPSGKGSSTSKAKVVQGLIQHSSTFDSRKRSADASVSSREPKRSRKGKHEH